MNRYIGIPILIFAAILDATVMIEFRIGKGAPDLVLLLVVSWALLVDLRDAMFWAVVGGVMHDLFSVAPLGASALGLVVVVFFSDVVFGQISSRNILIPPVVAAAGTVIYHLGIVLALQMASISVPFTRGFVYVTVPTLLYNVILIVPVFRVVGWLHGWLTPRRVQLD